MRPHTHTTPKPLLPVAGKPIVQRLVEDLAAISPEQVDEVAFIVHKRFGAEVEAELKEIAKGVGAEGSIHYQETALGTAHAILSAKKALTGRLIVAFADTLFRADMKLDAEADGVIWVNKVEDPRPFGVVKLSDEGHITDFIEKPEEFVSDLAIIGIYYFKDGDELCKELQYLLDNDIKDKDEYQLTNALENMKAKGAKFKPGAVLEWMDCGNKNAMVDTNTRVLGHLPVEGLVDAGLNSSNATIIPPCYIAENVTIKNAVIGPNVSVGAGSMVSGAIVKNTILGTDCVVENAVLDNSMLGNNAKYQGRAVDLSIGDHSTVAQ